MSLVKVPYVTIDVFTSERFKGNQLAVLYTSKELLATNHMQTIAREFNFSETVFLRQDEKTGLFHINIFTPVNEMDFAGHPVIGTGHVLFRQLFPGLFAEETAPSKITIMTKAGPVELSYEPSQQVVSAEAPHNIHIHSRGTPRENILDTQSPLLSEAASLKESYPAVSIVKGVTYTLVDFTEHPQLFAAIGASKSPVTDLDSEWTPSFNGVMYYRALESWSTEGKKIQNLRVRMIAINLEDPACGSGSGSLCTYLALQDGIANGEYQFHIDQGSEIGRDSKIIVDVVLNERGDAVKSFRLSGPASLVAEGTMRLPN